MTITEPATHAEMTSISKAILDVRELLIDRFPAGQRGDELKAVVLKTLLWGVTEDFTEFMERPFAKVIVCESND